MAALGRSYQRRRRSTRCASCSPSTCAGRRAVLLRRLRAASSHSLPGEYRLFLAADDGRLRRAAPAVRRHRRDEAPLRAPGAPRHAASAARSPKPRSPRRARRGCARIVLDTLPQMREAQALYALLGLQADRPYLREPTPGALLLRAQAFLIFSSSAVVERSCSNGIDTTCPPRAITPPAPTMRSTGQSPPFASTCGRQAAISASGVSSSNQVTARHALERGQHGEPVGERVERTVGALAEAAHRSVAVQRHQQPRAERARAGEIGDMAAVQEVEHAVGEHQRPRQAGEPALERRGVVDLGFEARAASRRGLGLGRRRAACTDRRWACSSRTP